MKIYQALIDLEKSCPELFYLIKNCKIETSSKPGLTAFAARTKTGFKIVINEAWVESFDVYNLAALIEHELLHVVLDHCTGLKDYSNKKLANVAMDAIINDIGHYFQNKDKLNAELKAGVYLENLNREYKSDFNSYRDSALDIYRFLETQKDQDKVESFDQGLDNSGQAGDEDGESSSGDSELDEALEEVMEGMDAARPGQGPDLDEMLSPSEVEDLFKVYGRKSSDVKTFLDAIEKRKKDRRIKSEIEKFFASNKAESKKSIKKSNKRFSFLPYGRIRASKQKVLVGVDVSGSMLNPDDLAKIKMSVLSATNNGFSVDLIFGDTRKLGGFKDIKSNFDFNKIFGGGGTELSFIFEENKKNAYDCLVIVTDGHFNHSEAPKKMKDSILFLNTTNYKVDGFKNLFI